MILRRATRIQTGFVERHMVRSDASETDMFRIRAQRSTSQSIGWKSWAIDWEMWLQQLLLEIEMIVYHLGMVYAFFLL